MSMRSSPTHAASGRRHQAAPPDPEDLVGSGRSVMRGQGQVDVERRRPDRARRARSLWARRAPARMAPTSPRSSASVKGATVGRNMSRGRAPDLRVAGLDHLGQLGQVDAGRLGQHLALVGGQPRAVGAPGCGPAWRPGRSRTGPWSRSASDGVEHRPDPVDDLGVAAHHAHQLAGWRPPPGPRSPRSRGRGTPRPAASAPMARDAGDRDGADDDDGGVRVGGGQAAVGLRTGRRGPGRR